MMCFFNMCHRLKPMAFFYGIAKNTALFYSCFMKNVFILTGAGISAESGLKTFRDANGLWDNYKVEDVASVEGFARNPKLVHEFYNTLRPTMQKAEPNAAHIAITEFEKENLDVRVHLITQNVDLLHEKAGSKKVLHMHGRIDETVCLHCGHVIKTLEESHFDDVCENCGRTGFLKPNIVFFGEMPMFMNEIEKCFKHAMCLLPSAHRGWFILRPDLWQRLNIMEPKHICLIWKRGKTIFILISKLSVKLLKHCLRFCKI